VQDAARYRDELNRLAPQKDHTGLKCFSDITTEVMSVDGQSYIIYFSGGLVLHNNRLLLLCCLIGSPLPLQPVQNCSMLCPFLPSNIVKQVLSCSRR
jgi:hypothetical protein